MGKKPIGRKAYGSIPHLLGSRLGPKDHHVHEGQDRICTERVRDKHDLITVQEKLDGSCTAVAKVNGVIIALGKAGYPASTSPFEMHLQFDDWVLAKVRVFDEILHEGERIVGEWLWQAHGTRYDLPHDFWVCFDMMMGTTRATVEDVRLRTAPYGLTMPHVLHRGGAISIAEVEELLGDRGHHGAQESAEGAVWRVERKGSVDFLAKYVRSGKIDGKYLDVGGPVIHNLSLSKSIIEAAE